MQTTYSSHKGFQTISGRQKINNLNLPIPAMREVDVLPSVVWVSMETWKPDWIRHCQAKHKSLVFPSSGEYCVQGIAVLMMVSDTECSSYASVISCDRNA